jgi:hypothetical protein
MHELESCETCRWWVPDPGDSASGASAEPIPARRMPDALRRESETE